VKLNSQNKFFGIIKFPGIKEVSQNYIAKNSMVLLAIQGVSVCLVFLSNFLLVRFAGVVSYGSYVYLFNLIYLLAGFGVIGLDTLLVKESSIYSGDNNYASLKGIMIFSLTSILFSALVMALIFRFFLVTPDIMNNTGSISWLTFSYFSVLMLSAAALLQSLLQGLRKIIKSQLGDKIFRPFFLIIIVTTFYYLKKYSSLDFLLWSNFAAIGITLLIVFFLGRSAIYNKIISLKPQFETQKWLSAAGAFFIADILYNSNARIGVVILGLFQKKDQVGIYNISLRVSEVISFALVIVNFVLSPLIARLYASGEKKALQKTITTASRAILLIGALLFLLILIFRNPILDIFGNDFLKGGVPLMILCCGQLINIFCGSVGLLLLMTGHQKYSIYSLFAGLLINIILNLVLTPQFGIIGTAIATACSLVVWNLTMYFFVRRKLQICPTAFGIF
jgi:O-antigen/teichoic acid export membrane protein